MKSLYGTIIGVAAAGCVVYAGTFLAHYTTNTRKELGSLMNNTDKTLTRIEKCFDEIENKLINIRINMAKLEGMVEGASAVMGYSTKSENSDN